MTDPIIELLRARPGDADQIGAVFPADEKAARIAAILAHADPPPRRRPNSAERGRERIVAGTDLCSPRRWSPRRS